jgi:hypothetical protein
MQSMGSFKHAMAISESRDNGLLGLSFKFAIFIWWSFPSQLKFFRDILMSFSGSNAKARNRGASSFRQSEVARHKIGVACVLLYFRCHNTLET